MVNYNDAVSIVIATLNQYQYSQRIIKMNRRCYSELSAVLSDQNTDFSLSIALTWCENSVSKNNKAAYKSAIHRLNDVYMHDRVLGQHLKFGGILPNDWKKIIKLYFQALADSSYSDETKRHVEYVITQFCGFLLCNNTDSLKKLDFGILGEYNRYAKELTSYHYRDMIGLVCRFLDYLADRGICRKGMSIYLHYYEWDKYIPLTQMTLETQEFISSRRSISLEFPVEDFLSTIPDFVNELTCAGYNPDVVSRARYHLHIFFIFLVMENLGYDRQIAEVWLKNVGENLFHCDAPVARREFDMYEDYVNEGGIIPTHHREKNNIYSKLPEWCKTEIDIFLNNKRKEGASKNTLYNLKNICSKFCQHIVSTGIHSLSELTPKIVKDFNINNKHVSFQGKNTYNRGIRNFLIHMELRGTVPSGISYALPCCYAGSETIVEILSDDDINLIQAYCKNANSPLELRNAAIFQIGMTTPFRASDVVNLKRENLDFKNHLFHIVQKKTGVEQIVPMSVTAGNAIFRYLKDARPKNLPHSFIFVSTRAPYGPLDSSACNNAMIDAKLSTTKFHTFRKTFGTKALRNGATSTETAELLGHTDEKTVHRYIMLDSERMRLCPLSLKDTGLEMEVDVYE